MNEGFLPKPNRGSIHCSGINKSLPSARPRRVVCEWTWKARLQEIHATWKRTTGS